MAEPTPAAIRFPVAPRDVPAGKAARLLHLTEREFRRLLPELRMRGFPAADETTGHFDLKAIERWMDERHSLTDQAGPANAAKVALGRLERLKRQGSA